ncbi:hypothetical protein RN001_000599 [Aquatica leii]|uniref:Uncharacterized protein n=1 Tax=Aquatica leii TaxID=1421715 RepID=A0AAN7QM42_9COLE|nr:hypothetical protein RN001_000599 [Aquatica leii]
MKILFYFAYLLFSTLNVYIYTKNVYDSEINFSGEDRELRSHPVKRKQQSYDQLYDISPYEHLKAEITDQNFLKALSNQRRRRIDDTSITGLNSEQENDGRILNSRLSKRSLEELESKEPFGLVYRKGRLLGILEPYQKFYEVSPYANMQEPFEERQSDPAIQSEGDAQYSSNRLPCADDSEKDESSESEFSRYTNDKYPTVLANFKIDNKLNSNKREKTHLVDKIKVKHSLLDDSDFKAVEKKSIFNLNDEQKIQSDEVDSSDKVDAIEDDLRKILNDVGLIEGDLIKDNHNTEKMNKRDITNEDENLEEGLNKIDIVKAANDPEKSDRMKRTKETTENKLAGASLTENEETNNSQSKRETSSSNIRNYQTEGEMYLRSKRNEIVTESNDIMKGLEKSGELTVSGNKSPLAMYENESKTTDNRKNFKRNEDYEKQLELNIQQKINAIKEEVKREIASLQEKKTKKLENAQRRKRQTADTLLEKELKTLNPQEHPEGDLVPYIRIKRGFKNVKPHKRSKRNLGEIENYDNSVDVDNTSDADADDDIVNDHNFKKKSTINKEFPIKKLVSNAYSFGNISHSKLTEKELETQDNIVKMEDKSKVKYATNLGEEVITSNAGALQTQASFSVTKGVTNYPKMQRQRRQADGPSIFHSRKKRGEAVMPDGNIAYLGYRGEDNDVDEEGDEFEDDGFDDRSAGMHKRDINNIQDYQNVLDYEMSNNGYGTNQIQRYPSRKFVSNSNSDVYEHEDLLPNNYLSYDPSPYIRKKRHDFDQIISLHGGGPMLNHLSAVRERNMRQLENEGRSRRNRQQPSKIIQDNKNERENAVELSDVGLFGPLPQSYEGELSRFKRVKRSDTTSSIRKNKSTRKLQ